MGWHRKPWMIRLIYRTCDARRLDSHQGVAPIAFKRNLVRLNPPDIGCPEHVRPVFAIVHSSEALPRFLTNLLIEAADLAEQVQAISSLARAKEPGAAALRARRRRSLSRENRIDHRLPIRL